MQRIQPLFALSTGMLLIALLTFMACHSTQPLGSPSAKNKSAAKDSSKVKKPDDGPSEFFQ